MHATSEPIRGRDAVEAARLRKALADDIAACGTFRTSAVEAAFRAVPRHLFLPGVGLEMAYGAKPVVTKRAGDGTSISSASSPNLVAAMLEQLGAQPGDRILEIGAATGINAALLAEIVRPDGAVVAIELDDDLAASAAQHLVGAGYPQVKVLCGDGAAGHPDGAPYDGIIVTAEAWDIEPAWWDQLAIGGRLVIPMRLHDSGLTRALGFTRLDATSMIADAAEVCGFVPMRGLAAHDQKHIVLADDVVLQVDASDVTDHDTLSTVLTGYEARVQWTGILVRDDEPAQHLDLWLATKVTMPFSRLAVEHTARESGLADPARRWAGASIHDGGTLAYVATRPVSDDTDELGIIAHGPHADSLTAHLAGRLHRWATTRPSLPRITAVRAGNMRPQLAAGARISRPATVMSIEW